MGSPARSAARPEGGIGRRERTDTTMRSFAGVCIVVVAVGGCADRVDSERYLRQWYMMTCSPLQASHGEAEPTEAPREFHYAVPTEDMGLRFSSVTSYGPWRVLRAPGQALLLDPTGKAVWAGTWVLPARENGRLARLVLMKGMGVGVVYDCGEMYDVQYLDIRQKDWKSHALTGWQMAFMAPPFVPELTWVRDIDGDGTDEILYTIPQGPPGCPNGFVTLLSIDGVRWVLYLDDLTWSGPLLLKIPLPEGVFNPSIDLKYKDPKTLSMLVPVGDEFVRYNISRDSETGKWRYSTEPMADR